MCEIKNDDDYFMTDNSVYIKINTVLRRQARGLLLRNTGSWETTCAKFSARLWQKINTAKSKENYLTNQLSNLAIKIIVIIQNEIEIFQEK